MAGRPVNQKKREEDKQRMLLIARDHQRNGIPVTLHILASGMGVSDAALSVKSKDGTPCFLRECADEIIAAIQQEKRDSLRENTDVLGLLSELEDYKKKCAALEKEAQKKDLQIERLTKAEASLEAKLVAKEMKIRELTRKYNDLLAADYEYNYDKVVNGRI